MTRDLVKELVKEAIKTAQKEKRLPDFAVSEIIIEHPKKDHGDVSTNIALLVASLIHKPPMELAGIISDYISSDMFEKVERAEPGFINFYFTKSYLQKEAENILKQGKKFGQLNIGKREKVNLEFISANPTGPLHVGNARGGFCGDVLANVLEKAGYRTKREYYVNNVGNQIKTLDNSLKGLESGYNNSYIDELKKKGVKDVKKAVDFIVEKIKKTTERIGIKFDKWFFESDLKTDKAVEDLKKTKMVFEKEGALWFRATDHQDDKDRVLIKPDGEKTYFLSDIAYFKNKFQRGFDSLIIFLGAEHHGYVPRLKAAMKALGYDVNKTAFIIYQLVRLFEKGKEVKMSKRTGLYVTIDELIDEVGLDVARYFFLTRNYGSHLIFDLDLAKEQSDKNPVFYVQYAHARISSILRKSKQKPGSKLGLLGEASELHLIKELLRFPEVVEDTARDYQVQRLPQYSHDLAMAFHSFYQECQVISQDRDLTQARLGLVLASKTVLKNILNLMGISAPEKM